MKIIPLFISAMTIVLAGCASQSLETKILKQNSQAWVVKDANTNYKEKTIA
jgi:hypothetical protein|tara:strand:- start:1504 stop:1656 length:153 start_codon:yes stop_codon:yes gene_type:complete